MKYISIINPAIAGNMGCLIVEMCTSFIDLKVGVSLDRGVLLCFISFLALQTLWETFQAKNNVKSAPASTALTLVPHQSHNARTTNCHLRGSGERNGEQR